MKKYILLALFIFAASQFSFAAGDLDSLKQKLQLTTTDSLKGPVYSQIADQYLKYDTISNRVKKMVYQNEALNYTMLALHNYSRYNDSTGLRICFDNLARVYHSQRKYSQAKWFILQSNSISRIQMDVPNLIGSLIKLSAIKMDLKEYKMAMRDLNEALSLSTANHYPQLESAVQQNYGFLYNRMKDYEKGDIALKRAAAIDENIKRDEELKLLAVQSGQDSVQVKKIDSISKKKVYASVNKKSFKSTSVKRIASL